MDSALDRLRLRPHHAYCGQFLSWDFPERGPAFMETEARVRTVLRSDTGTLIEIVEGADVVCPVCPLLQNGGCRSPRGDETEVRKWDGILLRELGIGYGTIITAARLRDLVRSKAPLPFCQKRCPYRATCPGAAEGNP